MKGKIPEKAFGKANLGESPGSILDYLYFIQIEVNLNVKNNNLKRKKKEKRKGKKCPASLMNRIVLSNKLV